MSSRKNRHYSAVRWLLSETLVSKLKSIARNSFISDELNLRDWMPYPAVSLHDTKDEAWFDYIADTGDDSEVMEVMAECVCQPFAITAAACAGLPDDARALVMGALGGADRAVLLRGELLFMGGDTAYPVADEPTLWDRVVQPLNRASAKYDDGIERELFGIPGNHDYYDDLVGFNRMFRRAPPAGIYPPTSPHRQVLPLTGFRRVQDASYVRIRLPGWELWGADFWDQAIDYRQRAYFRPNGAPPPRNLILCSQTPPIALGKYTASASDRASYDRLLGPGFDVLERYERGLDDQRLMMVSGDAHHYARYQPPRPDMTCIVSGGGGAFGHPTETELGGLSARVMYPSQAVSTSQSARGLATVFPTMFAAGWVWLVGALLAALVMRTAPRELGDISPAGLVFWGLAAAGAGVIYASHWITGWARRQHRRDYVEVSGRAAQHHRSPNSWYHWIRNTRPVQWLAAQDILGGIGLAARAAAVVAGVLVPYWFRAAWYGSVTAREVAFAGIALAVVIGPSVFAATSGGAGLGGRTRLGLAALGLAHGGFQLLIPLVAVRWGVSWHGLAAVVVWLAFGIVARWLYHRDLVRRVLVMALWLLQGGVVLSLVWSHGASWTGPGWVHELAALCSGAVIVPIQFSWYLLVAGCLDGHNNEIGSVLRSTRYKQFVRFHVTRARVTGYVIGMDDPLAAYGAPNPAVHAKLVDVFTLTALPE